MLAKLFSFHGRLARLEYLGWSLLIVIIMFGAGIAIGFAAVIAVHAGQGAVAILSLLAGAAMLIATVWTSLATTAKRVRHIGLSPLLVIGAVIAYDIIDVAVLTRFTSARFYWPFADYTTLGGIVNVAFMAVLLFWPGHDADAARSTPDDQPVVRTPRSPLPAAPRGEFGLRAR